MCRFVLSTTGRCGKVVTLCFRMADMFAKLPCGSQRRAPSRIRWTREKLAVKPRSRWEGGKNALSILEKSTGTIHVQGQRGPPVLWLDSRPTSPLLASAACCSSAIRLGPGWARAPRAPGCAPSCTSWERKSGRERCSTLAHLAHQPHFVRHAAARAPPLSAFTVPRSLRPVQPWNRPTGNGLDCLTPHFASVGRVCRSGERVR